MNDEEIAADAAINDTFLRMCVNSSPQILSVIFSKLTKYLAGKIVEPTVAGGDLSQHVQECGPVWPSKGSTVLHSYPGQEYLGQDEGEGGGEEGGV